MNDLGQEVFGAGECSAILAQLLSIYEIRRHNRDHETASFVPLFRDTLAK